MAFVTGALAILVCVVLAAISLALLGVGMPGPPRFPGPGGPAAFLIAGIVYGALAALFAVAAFGVFTERGWAWTFAVVVNSVALLLTLVRPVAAGHVTPDVLPLVALTCLALLLLVSRPGRTALRGG